MRPNCRKVDDGVGVPTEPVIIPLSTRVVAEERHISVAGRTIYRRRRRPSGEPRILAKLRRSTLGWLALTAVVVGLTLWAILADLDPPWFVVDEPIADWVAGIRTPWLIDVADGMEWLGSKWAVRIALWASALVLVAVRRWRQLIILVSLVAGITWLVELMADVVARPRPATALFGAVGFAHPSVEMAGISAVLVGAGLALVPGGRWQRAWLWMSFVLVSIAGTSLLYLGSTHVTDLMVGALVGAGAAAAAFALFAPERAFPISYSRGKAAHLPVSGARGVRLRRSLQDQLLRMDGPGAHAMRQALQDQLGCDIVQCEIIDIAHFGLAGSAGSTPLRLTVRGRRNGELFGKLYSTNHLRSDRWYKLGRAILYGRLEDERPFNSVRRLVQYEDYMLRVMADAGLPVPEPMGIVQIVPGREYLVVTEFIEGAAEIGDAEVTTEVADDALGIVRALWGAGLAHRDLKPANLLVHDGRVRLIDVAFAEVRPSPWREAVDLANMMLILGLHLGASAVYDRATRIFTEQEIAEAFAATHGITIPSELRSTLKAHVANGGEDILSVFRALAPDCPPIAIQRWSLRRMALSLAVLAGGAAVAALVIGNLRGVGLL